MDLQQDNVDGSNGIKTSFASIPPLAPEMKEGDLLLYKPKNILYHAQTRI